MNCKKIAAGIMALALVTGTTGFPEMTKSMTGGISTMLTAEAAYTIGDSALSFYVEDGVMTIQKSRTGSTVLPGNILRNYDGASSVTKIVIKDGVTGIADGAFDPYDFYNVRELVLPESMTSLGAGAFELPNLRSVYIPESVTSVDYSAFHDAGWYYDEDFTVVTENEAVIKIFGEFEEDGMAMPPIASPIPDTDTAYILNSDGTLRVFGFSGNTGVTEIPDNYFKSKTNINDGTNKIIIDDGITKIGSYCFKNYDNATSVEIAGSVKVIGKYAFQYCDALSDVKLGNGIETIGSYALSDIDITSIEIPDSVITIDSYAFYHCMHLADVKFGKNVKTIGYRSFESCYYLTSVDIPDSVENIRDYAFYRCDYLKNVKIGKNVKTIGSRAFERCDYLTSVDIPDSVETIGDYAFYSCSKLKNVTIGSGVEKIGEKAFYKCDNLKSVTIPANVTSIGNNAFGYIDTSDGTTVEGFTIYCTRDSAAKTYAAENGFRSIESAVIGSTALAYTLDGDGVMTIYKDKDEGSTTIPSAYFRYDVDKYYSDNVKKVVIKNGVTSIGEMAFYGCTKITEVTFPDSLKTISAYAFQYCRSLAEVTIPASVTSVDIKAFDSCDTPFAIRGYSGTAAETYANKYGVTFLPICDHIDENKNGECDSCKEILDGTAVLKSRSLNLDGTIGVNFKFYMSPDLTEDELNNTYVKFTLVNGRSQIVKYADSKAVTASGLPCRQFTCNVYSTEMAQEITASVYNGSKAGTSYNYSVKEYLDN